MIRANPRRLDERSARLPTEIRRRLALDSLAFHVQTLRAKLRLDDAAIDCVLRDLRSWECKDPAAIEVLPQATYVIV